MFVLTLLVTAASLPFAFGRRLEQRGYRPIAPMRRIAR